MESFLLPISGTFASITKIPYILIVLVVTTVTLLVSSAYYIVGLILGDKTINFIKHRFPQTEHKIDYAFHQFELYGASAVLIMRLIPFCRTYISFIAGAVKLNYITFITSSFIGITLWNSIFIGIGYLFFEQLETIRMLYTKYYDIIILLIVLVLFLWVYKVLLSYKTYPSNKN